MQIWYEFLQRIQTLYLTIAGTSGLESHLASDVTMDYTCGYACKGAENSSAWRSNLQSLLDNTDQNNNIRTVMGKFVQSINKLRSVPRDEALFHLSCGKYTISSSYV